MNNLNLGKTKSIEKQLNSWSKINLESNTAKENKTIEKGQWPKNTTLIFADSIINGVLEERLCRGHRNVKFRNFPGAMVDDLNHDFNHDLNMISFRCSKKSLVIS